MMKKIFALICVLLMLPLYALAEDAAETPLLEVHQMDLGYADGYFLRVGDIEIMIDGGKPVPFAENDDVMNCLAALGATELDVYIITHWHLDHCENVNVVLEKYGTADTVVYSPSEKLPKTVDNGINKKRYLEIGTLANGVYRQMKQGDVIDVGPLTIHCVGPANGGRYGKTNPDSLNFVLQYGTRRMLFTGDYAASGNINKVYTEICSNVDVLKFPHHGSRNGKGGFEIGENAIRTVNPEYVLVPTNKDVHWSRNFVRDFAGVESEKVLSGIDGHIVILTDGGEYLEAKKQQNPADYAPKAE